MRAQRFAELMVNALAGSSSLSAREFAEAGYDRKPIGFLLEVAGVQVYVQVTRTSPPGGDDFSKPENPAEGGILPPVPQPEVQPRDGRVHMRDVEDLLVATITNIGSPEISGVQAFSRREKQAYHRYGVAVEFHSGAVIYLLFVHALPGGAHPTDREYEIVEAV